jgi:hypothetical protein
VLDPLFQVYEGDMPETPDINAVYITLYCNEVMKTVAFSGLGNMNVDVCSMVNSAFKKDSFTNHCTFDFGGDVMEDYPLHNICNEISQEDCNLVPFCLWDVSNSQCDVDFCFWDAIDYNTTCSELESCLEVQDDRYSYCYHSNKQYFNSNFIYHTGASKNLTFSSTVFGTTYPLSILLYYHQEVEEEEGEDEEGEKEEEDEENIGKEDTEKEEENKEKESEEEKEGEEEGADGCGNEGENGRREEEEKKEGEKEDREQEEEEVEEKEDEEKEDEEEVEGKEEREQEGEEKVEEEDSEKGMEEKSEKNKDADENQVKESKLLTLGSAFFFF